MTLRETCLPTQPLWDTMPPDVGEYLLLAMSISSRKFISERLLRQHRDHVTVYRPADKQSDNNFCSTIFNFNEVENDFPALRIKTTSSRSVQQTSAVAARLPEGSFLHECYLVKLHDGWETNAPLRRLLAAASTGCRMLSACRSADSELLDVHCDSGS
ncbi:hypothetical protein BOX15_Mlig008189g1 [Macrostomum lignano]|uniref:Uncharacterized protein n=1 Tax=Macrostomum lignano TaxID=282301 RepID=A0A267E2G5_9PLAT|nr:hypothetical protein BOX15_Mlig008189g1 [Macrostomum lignano]